MKLRWEDLRVVGCEWGAPALELVERDVILEGPGGVLFVAPARDEAEVEVEVGATIRREVFVDELAAGVFLELPRFRARAGHAALILSQSMQDLLREAKVALPNVAAVDTPSGYVLYASRQERGALRRNVVTALTGSIERALTARRAGDERALVGVGAELRHATDAARLRSPERERVRVLHLIYLAQMGESDAGLRRAIKLEFKWSDEEITRRRDAVLRDVDRVGPRSSRLRRPVTRPYTIAA